MTLSVVLPCYNEEANVEQTVRDVVSWFTRANVQGEVIAVNDGSADGTAEVLERLSKELKHLKIVHHVKNQGYGAAIRTGCDAAEGDVLAFMDSDGQFHAEDIARLLQHLDRVNLVGGIRVKRADPFNRKLNAWLYGRLVRLVLRIRVIDLNCGLKVYRRTLWERIRPAFATGALFNAEIFLNMTQIGEPWVEVPVPHYPRTAGAQTGAKPTVIFRMFRELFALKRASRARFAKIAANEKI